MKADKFRLTNQRQLILDYLNTTPLHPTADQVFRVLRRSLPRISFGTVYRNLDILNQQGLIRVLHYSKEHARYDAVMDNHCHFICERCDKVRDLVLEELAELNSQVAKRHDWQIQRHSLFFYGWCPDCQKVLRKVQD